MSNSRNFVEMRQGVSEVDEIPILLGKGKYCHREKAVMYKAFDYIGHRFHCGEHVGVRADSGNREWVIVIDSIFKCPKDGEPSFRGRWFWTAEQVGEEMEKKRKKLPRVKFQNCEVILSDQEDVNPINCIHRKCVVLSRDNFELFKQAHSRGKEPWRNFYFCERLFRTEDCSVMTMHKAFFPGDPVAPEVLDDQEYGVNDLGMPRSCKDSAQYICSHAPVQAGEQPDLDSSNNKDECNSKDEPRVMQNRDLSELKKVPRGSSGAALQNKQESLELDPWAVFIV